MRNELEVMRVLRLPPLGKLVVEVNSQRFQTLSEITEENSKRRLLAAVGELIDFAGGYQNLVDAGVAPPLATAPDKATETTTTAAPEATFTREQAEFLARLEGESNALKQAPPRKPTFPVLSGIQPTISPPEKKLGIVEQIDEILQKHVMANPHLAERSIHFSQNPAGGLRLEVDGQHYQKPKDIKDPQIQQVIKKALKEWEVS